MGAYGDINVDAVSRHTGDNMGLIFTQLELLKVLIAIRIFGQAWAGQCVKLPIDNRAVVYALNKLRVKYSHIQYDLYGYWQQHKTLNCSMRMFLGSVAFYVI